MKKTMCLLMNLIFSVVFSMVSLNSFAGSQAYEDQKPQVEPLSSDKIEKLKNFLAAQEAKLNSEIARLTELKEALGKKKFSQGVATIEVALSGATITGATFAGVGLGLITKMVDSNYKFVFYSLAGIVIALPVVGIVHGMATIRVNTDQIKQLEKNITTLEKRAQSRKGAINKLRLDIATSL